MCKTESVVGEGTILNMSLILPQNLSQADDVCVTFVGPRSVLPVASAPPACTPSFAPQQGFTGRLMGQSRDSEVLGEREDDDWCKGGTVLRMVYHSNHELKVMLTGVSFLLNLRELDALFGLMLTALTFFMSPNIGKRELYVCVVFLADALYLLSLLITELLDGLLTC